MKDTPPPAGPPSLATVPVGSIAVGERVRRDLGDLAALAESIRSIGLLHPLVLTPDHRLIVGERRLRAVQSLGWADVPAIIAADFEDAQRALAAERDENTCRKDFAPSEAVTMAECLSALERAAARERQGTRTDLQPLPDSDRSPKVRRSDDAIASAVGTGRDRLAKAAAVVTAARVEPERYADLVDTMDRTGNVNAAHKELAKRREVAAVEALAATVPPATDRYEVHCAGIVEAPGVVAAESVDWIVTDPPYPREYLPLYSDLARFAVHALRPGGSALVMVGQTYLPEVLARMTVDGLGYRWTLAYLTPGGQAVQQWQATVNTFWKPVLWLTKGDPEAARWIGDVVRSDVNDNDKRFHGWGQSVSGMADLLSRFVHPGDVVCDPFCGGGTTGVAALGLGCYFVGLDIDTAAVARTAGRAVGVAA